MRYSDRVTFIKEGAGGYNPDTGRHEKAEPSRYTVPCNLSYMSLDRQRELFGRIDRRTAVVRLLRPYNHPFDYAEIEGRRYELLSKTPLRSESAFYFEEVAP